MSQKVSMGQVATLVLNSVPLLHGLIGDARHGRRSAITSPLAVSFGRSGAPAVGRRLNGAGESPHHPQWAH